MIFFVILELILIAGRVVMLIFSDKIPAAAATAMTWICVVIGIIAALFVVVEIYKRFKK